MLMWNANCLGLDNVSYPFQYFVIFIIILSFLNLFVWLFFFLSRPHFDSNGKLVKIAVFVNCKFFFFLTRWSTNRIKFYSHGRQTIG